MELASTVVFMVPTTVSVITTVAMSESCTKCINVEAHKIKQFRPGLVYTHTIYFTSIFYIQLKKTCLRPNLIPNHIPVIAHLGGFLITLHY